MFSILLGPATSNPAHGRVHRGPHPGHFKVVATVRSPPGYWLGDVGARPRQNGLKQQQQPLPPEQGSSARQTRKTLLKLNEARIEIHKYLRVTFNLKNQLVCPNLLYIFHN